MNDHERRGEPMDWKERIMGATSLDELCEAINQAVEEVGPGAEQVGIHWTGTCGMRENDLSSLPTFGGPEPDTTCGIFSWDSTRLMVPGNGGHFELIQRNR
jgi:hypothetical protein